MTLNRVLAILTFLLPLTAYSAGNFDFVKHWPVPGGIAIVDLGLVVEDESEPPKLRWNNRPIAAIARGGQWFAMVGIPLSVEPGKQSIAITQPGAKTTSITYFVEPHAYEEQRITLENKAKVNPPPMDMKRIKKESAHLKAVKTMRSDKPLAAFLKWPVAGPISSPFGLRRYFNDQPRRPHGGIDIAAPADTEIVAPADGVIIDTGEYFFNGNSVFIEHGLGMQTFYAHLNTIAVNNGDVVKAGDVIGTIGATGRVTGPHLHWSVGLNGTWVNPLLLLDESMSVTVATVD